MAILRYAHKISTLCLCMLLATVLVGCVSVPSSSSSRQLTDTTRPFSSADLKHETEDASLITLDIVSIGDILMHYPWQQEYDSTGNSLFPEYFQYISGITTEADLALCNPEAPFAGGEPAGYPRFNMGDSLAPALEGAGFDVSYTSHNHTLDQGNEAVLRTVEVLRGSNLQVTGTRLSADEPNYAFITTQGVNIAVIAYSYESLPNTLNGLPISEDMDPLINSYTAGDAEDLAEMQALIESARAAGADLVVFYLHAGTEYSHEPNDDQRGTAQFLADVGVDIIFGSHVHVVQPMELLQPTDGTAPVPVYWGMGNYISGQVIEWGMELANEEGILAQVELAWNPRTKEVDEIAMDYIPLWNCYYTSSTHMVHTVIPEVGDVAANPSIQASGNLERAQNAFTEIRSIVGESLSWQRG